MLREHGNMSYTTSTKKKFLLPQLVNRQVATWASDQWNDNSKSRMVDASYKMLASAVFTEYWVLTNWGRSGDEPY